MIDKHLLSAIIGYWRSGTSLEWICVATNLPYKDVESIINDYNEHLMLKN